MTNIDTQQTTSLSFEFFPPHSEKAEDRLFRSVERLAPLGPKYVSVTYGAGGTTRKRTLDAIRSIREKADLSVAGHLTVVGADKQETLDVAKSYADLGVDHIVALRGDAPKGEDHFTPHPQGFNNALDLVSGLKGLGSFHISVAAYPEKHPDSEDTAADIENLKCKIDAGGDAAITQFFFENDTFLRFRDACDKAGINAPIIPGILPIENFEKMTNFAARCHANVPEWMHELFSKVDTAEASQELAISLCAKQCQGLMSEGVNHLHIYTLNNPDLPYTICRELNF